MSNETLLKKVYEIFDRFDPTGEYMCYIPELLQELRQYKISDTGNPIISEETFLLDGHEIYIQSYGSEVTDIMIDGTFKDIDDGEIIIIKRH